MKKAVISVFAALVVIFTGCNKIKHLADINVDIPYSAQVSVPVVAIDTAGAILPPGGLSLPFPAVAVATNSQQYMSQYHTAAGMVLNVYLKALTIQITSPANQNFDYLDSVQLFISAPTQPEVLAAYEYNVPKGQTILSLTANTGLNLKNYFIQDTIYFRMQAHINAIPASGTNLNITSVFHLLANPLY